MDVENNGIRYCLRNVGLAVLPLFYLLLKFDKEKKEKKQNQTFEKRKKVTNSKYIDMEPVV